MNTPTPQELLGGAYELRPGQPHSVSGQRPVLGAGRLGAVLRGRESREVGPVLSGIFTLCAHAHVRAADLALAAAQGRRAGDAARDASVLLAETARDHLRSIALDWPQRLAAANAMPDLRWLSGCPLRLAGAGVTDAAQATHALAQLREWLERDILLQPAPQWLAVHRRSEALSAWCDAHAARLPPARCLAQWHPLTAGLTPPSRWLEVLNVDPVRQDANLRALAAQIAGDAGFVQQPIWDGAPAENGPWARLRHLRAGTPLVASVWDRLTARWLELVQIAVDGSAPTDRPPLLVSGAMALTPGAALAWCEMARGLLFHWVCLDERGAILDYRVLAPTEWNFHRAGTLALLVAQLVPADVATARALAAAFDPCVACSVAAA